MKKVSVKKMSALGLVLLAASAVTAAILPNKSNDIKFDGSEDNATLLSNSGIGGGATPVSCVTDITLLNSCHLTAESGTTAGSVLSDLVSPTAGNTSNSTPNDGNDTTSAAS